MEKLIAFLCREVADGVGAVRLLPHADELVDCADKLDEDLVVVGPTDRQKLIEVDAFIGEYFGEG